MAPDFASFIRGIERGLIGCLRFSTLDAARSEELFARTCDTLRHRWPNATEGTAFEIAAELALEKQFKPRDDDEVSRELRKLSSVERMALCLETFGPIKRESAMGKRMLQCAPAPSLQRQMRALRTTFKSLVAVALSLCFCLALVAGFGALHASYPQPETKPPADWLGDEITKSLELESDTTYGPGALAKPAQNEREQLAAIKLDFDILTPKALPEGYRLKEARVFTHEQTGLGFSVLRLIYTDDETELILIEAEGGFPWLTEFTQKAAKNVIHMQRYGTAVLAFSRHFDPKALQEIAAGLKPHQ